MKKLLMVLSILILMTTVLLSLEKSEKLDKDIIDRLNTHLSKYQLQKITYNGVEGYFMPFAGWNQLNLDLRDYIYYQDLVLIKDERIKQLERYEIMNFKLKTGLAIAISFDVGTTLVAIGLGMLCYNIAKQ